MPNSTSSTVWERIRELLAEEGLPHYGFARVMAPAAAIALYRDWLERDFAGEMDYLHRHLPFKEDPTQLMSHAQSAIVLTFDYSPHPQPKPSFPLQEAKVALYARGEDYHFWIKRRLQSLITRLQTEFPNESFAAYTDSAPVLERDLAQRAGLGWIGKNTCLIHPKRGSLFLIGEIYTTLTLNEERDPLPDFCGTCTRCLDACPTGALVAPHELDARKCISYLTIESKQVPPEDMREKTSGWFFGCDICQTVCPWNVKFHGTTPGATADPSLTDAERRVRLIEEMRVILTSTNTRLLKLFHGTPLVRAGGKGLKRNAILVAIAMNLRELTPEITALREVAGLGALVDDALARLARD
ncbi:MAG: tRNA epoxyqueuosine(34) reductase QueG [Bdellovibrionaceae bacterium]|nr:tRNA epoxyqueuosine(34) reductase QueG [Pseudobdellovibrionaceae bacterium]